MDNSKQVEICNIDQWRGPSDQQGEADDFMSLITPFIRELDGARMWQLRQNAEACQWDWKLWEMTYVYRHAGDVYQKVICDIGGSVNPLIRLFAMKGAICHMYDLLVPPRNVWSQLSYARLVQNERQDMCSLDCPDDTFDIVYSISTFEHVAKKRSAFLEMIRVTKPGGLVICTCDACSRDLDYQLEDPFFSNCPLNESAIEDLLGLSINLPDERQCWDLWRRDGVYMSRSDRWPDLKDKCKGTYTALGFVLRIKDTHIEKERKYFDLGPVAAFDSAHSASNHLVWGFYNVDSHGGRLTRKAARLRLKYDAKQHNCFFLKGFYPNLSRTANSLRIAVGGTTVASIPLMDGEHILDLCVAVPTNLASGTVFVDLEVEKGAEVADSPIGILVHECGFTKSRLPLQEPAEGENMSHNSIYAVPRLVTDINECIWYHTMDIPGYGVVKGHWDLREGMGSYLGNLGFEGKRVLDVGTANGFICFYMENKGAEVVAYDLSENHDWDIVPLYSIQHEQLLAKKREDMRRINNAYWLSHKALNSRARMVYGTVYAIPRELGMVDISVFGNILSHVRDPLLALQNALRLTKETIIITQAAREIHRIHSRWNIPVRLLGLSRSPGMKFVPTSRMPLYDIWWDISPEILKRWIGVLGFEDVRVNYHKQRYCVENRDIEFYTLVGHRTREHYAY